jgi:dTDP-glucose pyrophosphorylase
MIKTNPNDGLIQWREALLAPSASLRIAIETLNRSSFGILLVCNLDEKLLGTLSDGDIRRGVLRGMSLDDSIETLFNQSPICVKSGADSREIGNLMTFNKILQIPELNEEGKVVGLHLWRDIELTSRRQNHFVIMAGGSGRRLLPLTEKTPKPMLQVLGKPIIEHIITQARNNGFNKFTITLHHLGEVIMDYFGDGSSLGVRIDYLVEEKPLGTAGSLRQLELDSEEPLVVTNGDVLSSLNYGRILDFHIENNAFATMAVHVHQFENPFGVVKVEQLNIVDYEEKPVVRSLANSGIYAINKKAILLVNRDEFCDMPTLFARARSNREKTIVYPLHEDWIDIGRPEEFERAKKFIITATDRANGSV